MTENKTARLLCDVYWGEDRGRLSKRPKRELHRMQKNFSKRKVLTIVHGDQKWSSLYLIKIHWDVLTPYKGQSYSIESEEAPWNQSGVLDIQWDSKKVTIQVLPQILLTPFRNECVNVLNENFGILCDNHHHEVATAGQCEIDIRYDYLTNAADARLNHTNL